MSVSSPESTVKIFSLLDLPQNTGAFPSKIALHAHEISANVWREIVAGTRLAEKGRVTSFHNGRLFHGLITAGREERPDLNGPPGVREPASWSPGLFPHGLNSWRYLVGMLDILDTHSHPMEERDRFETSILSDNDLIGFTESNLWARIMVDRGGGHLILKSYHSDTYENLDWQKIIHKSFQNQAYIVNVMKALGGEIYDHGLQYFWTPKIDHPENDLVTFTDVRFLPTRS